VYQDRHFQIGAWLTVLATALYLSTRASYADQYGDSRWCHVENKGDVMSWDCEYDTIEECQPVIANGGGFCAMNPYWHPDPSSNSGSSSK
jgi:hypothetical protein